MTYLPNKPDQGSSPSIDVSTIQGNFAAFNNAFSVNHIAMNQQKQGDHAAIIFQLQSADPGVTQDLDVLYNKNATSNAGTQPQLFVQIPLFLPTANDTTNAPNAPMQLTYNSVNVAGPQYQSFITGGYLVFMGTTTDITVPITLSTAPTALLLAIATPNTLNGSTYWKCATQILTSSTFKIISNATGIYSFTWIAIGTV